MNAVRRETGRSLEVTNLGRDVWNRPHEQPVEGGTIERVLFEGNSGADRLCEIVANVLTDNDCD